MSATTTGPTRARHALIRRTDTRGRGSWHAAVPVEWVADEPWAWRTACGERLEPTDVVRDAARAHAILRNPDAPLCARCDRVGNAR